MYSPTPRGMMFRGPGANPWDTPPINGDPAQQPPQMMGPGPVEGNAPFSIMPDDQAMPPMAAMDLPNLAKPSFHPNDVSVRRPAFFSEGGTGRAIAGALGDALLSINHSAPIYGPMMQERRAQEQRQRQQAFEWQRQDRQRTQDRAWQVEDRDAKLHQPQYFMSGRDRVAFDPTSGQSSVVYDGPEDYQNYADTLGLEPGQDGYDSAVQDFVLRGNGPTSLAGRQALEGTRQQNRLSLRATPTYANLHPQPRASRSGGGRRGGMAFSGPPRTVGNVYAPILGKVAAGQPLSPGEQEVYNNYRARRSGGGGSGGGPAASAPTTMRNPKTGQTVKLVNGKWIPA